MGFLSWPRSACSTIMRCFSGDWLCMSLLPIHYCVHYCVRMSNLFGCFSFLLIGLHERTGEFECNNCGSTITLVRGVKVWFAYHYLTSIDLNLLLLCQLGCSSVVAFNAQLSTSTLTHFIRSSLPGLLCNEGASRLHLPRSFTTARYSRYTLVTGQVVRWMVPREKTACCASPTRKLQEHILQLRTILGRS